MHRTHTYPAKVNATTPATLFALLYAAAILLHIVWPPVFQPTPAKHTQPVSYTHLTLPTKRIV